MAGMLFILFLLACFCLLVFVSWLAVRWARRRGRRGWPYGMVVFLMEMVLLFWDWLPMEMSYKDKCESEAGLTVYKVVPAKPSIPFPKRKSGDFSPLSIPDKL